MYQWLSEPVMRWTHQGPASFDRYNAVKKEWSLLVGTPDRREWWIETRSGRNHHVTARLPLNLPPSLGQFHYFGSSTGLTKYRGNAILCSDYVREKDGFKFHYLMLDPNNGEILQRFSIDFSPHGKIDGDGDRIAFAAADDLALYDLKSRTKRTIPCGSVSNLFFSPDGNHVGYIDWHTRTFHLVEWETGKKLNTHQIPRTAESFCFLDNNTIMLIHDSEQQMANNKSNCTLSRWRWNSDELVQISHGVRINNKAFFPSVKYVSPNELHLCVDADYDWPLSFKPILQWLSSRNWHPERWYPQKYYYHWRVLNEQDRVVSEYYSDNHTPTEIGTGLAVEIETDIDFSKNSITVRNTNAIWPNALASGLLIYIAICVFMKQRGLTAPSF
ncbi:MAG: hypothetical protein U0796_14440 [Gemmatales bacterium]